MVCLKFPEVSRSSLYSIVTEHLGYKNLFASLFSKLLTDNHKKRLQFHLFKNQSINQSTISQQRTGFFKSIVVDNETWIHYMAYPKQGGNNKNGCTQITK